MKTSREKEAANPAESFHGTGGQGDLLLPVAELGPAGWHQFGKTLEPLNDREPKGSESSSALLVVSPCC